MSTTKKLKRKEPSKKGKDHEDEGDITSSSSTSNSAGTKPVKEMNAEEVQALFAG